MIRFGVLLFFSLVIVSSSPIWHKEKITELDQLEQVPLGFPIHFMKQSTSLTPMEEDLPIYVSMMDIREHRIYDFSVFLFLLNVFLIFSLMNMIAKVFDLIVGRKGKRRE